jgi:hypothetical protein
MASDRTSEDGLLIASRFPLVYRTSEQKVPWPERVLSVEVTTPNRAINVHTTHIPPGSSNGWLKVEMLEAVSAQDGTEVAVPPGREAGPPRRRQPSDRERPTATPPCRPTSRPCRAGNTTSGAASTRSSCTVPDVRKAVTWNSPFHGIEGQGWFLNFHCFTKYVKVAFFRGTSLRPLTAGESKHKEVRYLDIHEDDQLDEAQLASWVKQASQLPGEEL